jgi:hypothetical protein
MVYCSHRRLSLQVARAGGRGLALAVQHLGHSVGWPAGLGRRKSVASAAVHRTGVQRLPVRGPAADSWTLVRMAGAQSP